MSRFVRPDTVKVDLSDGDWLLLKRRLTAGESRRAFARTVKKMEIGGGPTQLDPEAVGLAAIVSYLLDWSLVDDAGQGVIVRDQPPEVVESVLLALDTDSFNEILRAVFLHEARITAAVADEKKTRSGESRPSVTSISAA